MNPKALLMTRGGREAAKQLQGMDRAHRHAMGMLAAGKITEAELQEFDAYLLTEAMKALPMETYAAMRADGSWDTLETLASHDGSRDGYDVTKERGELGRKIMRDALNEFWIGGQMDDDTFKSQSQKLGMPEDLTMAITDKDENAAIDTFVLNSGGEKDYDGYRDEVKKNFAAPTWEEPQDSLKVSADDVREFQARHNIEPDEAPAHHSDGAAASSGDSEAAGAE